ncbi:MAG: hypothetical protein ABJH08_11770 [Balneola sp.]
MSEKIPSKYIFARVLSLTICLPAALYIIISNIFTEPLTSKQVILDKKEGEYTVKSKTYDSYSLITEKGSYSASLYLFMIADIGDTLIVKEKNLTISDYKRIQLINNNEIEYSSANQEGFTTIIVFLLLLFPLSSLRNYCSWKDNPIFKIYNLVIPISVSFSVLLFLFVWWIAN